MGRPPLLDQKLVAKIAKKLGKSKTKVVKAVSAMATRQGIASESALILFARKHKVGSATAQRKLDQGKQLEIRSTISGSTASVSTTVRRGKLPAKKLDSNPEFQDLYLSESIYSALPAEAYSILFILENSLRLFVERILAAKYGSDWWLEIGKKKATSEIAKKVGDRKKNESENWHHTKRGVHEVYYTDYSDLLQLMRTFDTEFSSYFKKGAEKNLPGKLAELVPTRNVVAHNNPITKNDLDRLRIHVKDWIKYMQHLYSQAKK